MNLLVPAALLACVATTVAQGTGLPSSGGQPAVPLPSAQDPGQEPGQVPTSPFVPGTQLPGASNPREVLWTLPRPQGGFEGFPVFPSMLAGYGSYAKLQSDLAARGISIPGAVLPPATDEAPGWPSWVRTRDRAPLPFAPDLGLLVRHADRVWHREVADEPFTPLSFHDKFRTLRAGGAIEVRQLGEFELLLHTSSRLLARGPTTLALGTLSESEVRLEVPQLTWLRLATTGRRHVVTLPDGSTLVIAAPVAVNPLAALLAPAGAGPLAAGVGTDGDVVLVRADEPAWLGGRITLTNFGSAEVRWQHASGEVVVPRDHRVTLFPSGAREVVPAALAASVPVRSDGAALVCGGAEAGTVSWGGARFVLPAGAVVRFEPQQGQPFAASADRRTP